MVRPSMEIQRSFRTESVILRSMAGRQARSSFHCISHQSRMKATARASECLLGGLVCPTSEVAFVGHSPGYDVTLSFPPDKRVPFRRCHGTLAAEKKHCFALRANASAAHEISSPNRSLLVPLWGFMRNLAAERLRRDSSYPRASNGKGLPLQPITGYQCPVFPGHMIII
jgi:hypothetical protein